MTRRKKRAFVDVVVAALAGWASVQGRADAQLRTDGAMSSTWTAGPTRLTFAMDQNYIPYVFEQRPGWSFYVYLGGTSSLTSINERVAPVVIQPNGPGTWETHVFLVQSTYGTPTVAHWIRGNDGSWGAAYIPPLPVNVVVGSGLGAASNVYRRGDALSPQGSVAQMAVYFIGTNGLIYTATYNNGVWSQWTWLGFPLGGGGLAGPIEVTSEFNNGVFSTSVWVVGRNMLQENRGVFNGSRTWINHFGNFTQGQRPAGVTWYDRTGAMNPSFAHTRVYLQSYPDGAVQAFFREPGEVTGWDNVDRIMASPMSAGVFVGNCGGCLNPPEESVVLGLNFTAGWPDYVYLPKDNGNTSPSYQDTWIPIIHGDNFPQHPSFTRMDYGGGIGPIYAVNNSGHLMELNPATNTWLNHGYPGMTYSYATPVFDTGDKRLYTGDGDWAVGEFKGECGSNEWTIGVSTSATQAHSMRCAWTDTTTNFTSFQSTLDISSGNDGYGNHGLGDWDYGYFKGECPANAMVTGLSLASGGALSHVRCSDTPAYATRCRALPFPSSDNRETPNSVGDWAVGYYKAECASGSAITGVSRSVATGDVHAVLCCDFSMM
jgi:hypothetical protein